MTQMKFTDLRLKGGDHTMVILLLDHGPMTAAALRGLVWWAPDDDIDLRLHRLELHRYVSTDPLPRQQALAFGGGPIFTATPWLTSVARKLEILRGRR